MRLQGFDYASANAFFVTACIHRKEFLLGDIHSEVMRESAVGMMVRATWDALPLQFPHVSLDEFVVMPNHVHGIVWVNANDGIGGVKNAGAASGAPTMSVHLGRVMRVFKSLSAIAVNRHLGRLGYPLWQRNYYEHVIRDEAALEKFRGYIRSNPLRWDHDKENPLANRLPRSG